jgi:hypothetical protein
MPQGAAPDYWLWRDGSRAAMRVPIRGRDAAVERAPEPQCPATTCGLAAAPLRSLLPGGAVGRPHREGPVPIDCPSGVEEG